MHAHGNLGSARRAIAALADFIGKSVEDTARAILDIATDKVIPVVDGLIAEYKLDRDQAVLVGEGGGAAALIPHASSRTGIGANTAIFSVVNGVLLRPLAYPDPGRLLMIFETTSEFGQGSVAYPNFLDWRRAGAGA